MKTATQERRRNLFAGTWLAASVFFIWQLSRGAHSFESPGAAFSLAALLLCALALMWWIPSPVRNEPSDQPTRKWRFAYRNRVQSLRKS